jgi:hypothetical protein
MKKADGTGREEVEREGGVRSFACTASTPRIINSIINTIKFSQTFPSHQLSPTQEAFLFVS